MTTTISVPDNALTITETTPFRALTTRLRADLTTLFELGVPVDSQVRAQATRLGLDASVPTQWLYTGMSGHPDDDFDLDIVLPISTSAPITPGDSLTVKDVPAFRCAQYTYTGSWRHLGGIYDALFGQFYAADLVYDGRVREIYRVVDLQNPDNCVTDIQIGIA